jgi:hypothetical protein
VNVVVTPALRSTGPSVSVETKKKEPKIHPPSF